MNVYSYYARLSPFLIAVASLVFSIAVTPQLGHSQLTGLPSLPSEQWPAVDFQALGSEGANPDCRYRLWLKTNLTSNGTWGQSYVIEGTSLVPNLAGSTRDGEMQVNFLEFETNISLLLKLHSIFEPTFVFLPGYLYPRVALADLFFPDPESSYFGRIHSARFKVNTATGRLQLEVGVYLNPVTLEVQSTSDIAFNIFDYDQNPNGIKYKVLAQCPEPFGQAGPLTSISASASSQTSIYGPAKAVDGSESTFWVSSTSSATETLTMNLNGQYQLASMSLKWYSSSYSGVGFDVEYSLDGVHFSSLHAGLAPGTSTVSLENVEGTHIRLKIDKSVASYVILKEVEITGRPRQ